ncbi:hypothetical protein N9B82_02155 [Saprospiraceae bacterium]|nr:hypothetical protein [Saprospiraceae bacterium]
MKLQYYIFSFLFLSLLACEPQIDDKIILGAPPVATFDIIEGATPNDFTVTNTSQGTFITQWLVDFESDPTNPQNFEGDEAVLFLPKAELVTVTMTVFNEGGHTSLAKTITVTEDVPVECEANIELLTDCDEKVWKIAEEPAALHIGPSLDETWWGNGASDITDRPCHWNDRYIFRENGEFEFQANGDFWADSDGDGNVWPSDLGLDVGCHSTDAWPSNYQAWGSAIHNYEINSSSLEVIGTGAWLGLYKIGTSSEVDQPQESVKYTISEISANRMILFTDYGGVVWRITLVTE